MGEPRGLGRAFVALQHRPFRLLFLSSVTSGVGNHLQTICSLWQIYALTGSAFHLGINGLVRAVAIVLFSLAGGVIADRVGRKKVIIFTQVANGFFTLILALLTATGLVDVWHIYIIGFLNATLMSVAGPARRAVIVSLVPRRHVVNAMALNSSVMKIDRIVAPSLGGVLIAVVGLPLTYLIDTVAYFVTAAALGFVDLGPLPARSEASPLKDVLEGLAFVRARSVILVLLATDAAAMLFGSYEVLLPILADNFDMGPTGFGLLASAPAVGSLVGVSAIMYLGDVPYKGLLIVGSILAYCCCLVGLALSPWFWVSFAAAVGLGMTDSLQAAPRNAAIQLMSPDELRGRVSAFQYMLTSGIPSVGQGLMGGAAGAIGGPFALVAGAAICAAINVGILIRRSDLRARPLGTAAEQFPAGESTHVRVG